MQVRMLRAIDQLFGDVPQTRKTLELKEEMLQNLMEKYKDLVADGKSEDAAFQIAMESVGDISDLVAELRGEAPGPVYEQKHSLGDDIPYPKAPVIENPFDDDSGGNEAYAYAAMDPEEARRHSARVTAVAVMLFVLSPLPVICFRSGMGVVLLFAMIAAGIGLLIFNGMTSRQSASTETHETKQAETYSQESDKERKKLASSVSSAFWCLTVALYILISFYTGAWHISWIIFLVASAASSLIKLFLDPAGTKPIRALSNVLWTMTVAFYFILSFATGAWHISWVIYLVAAALNNILRIYLREEKEADK